MKNKTQYNGIGGKYSGLLSWVFFVLGIIGAIGLRIVLIAQHFNPLLARIVWYVAVIPFIFFYGYRFYIEEKRLGLIEKSRIREKLVQKNLDAAGYSALGKIIDSLLVSKMKINLFILFFATIAALAIELFLDLK